MEWTTSYCIDSETETIKYAWEVNLSWRQPSGKQVLTILADFVRSVLVRPQSHIRLLVENGQHVDCKLLWPNRRETECQIGLGWYKFCQEKYWLIREMSFIFGHLILLMVCLFRSGASWKRFV